MGNADDAMLPSGWRVGPSADFTFAKERTTRSAGTSGTDALTSASPGVVYNFASGDNLTSTDRAVGFLSTPDNVQNKNLHAGFQNNSGSTLSEIHLSYDIEKYRTGIRSTDLRFFYGFDGVVWTEVTGALQHYDADAATAVINPPTTVTKNVALSNLSIPDQSAFYLRWFYVPSTVNSTQALGIDNFSISFNGSALPRNLTWNGAAGANWDDSSPIWKDSGGNGTTWSDSAPDNALLVAPASGVSTSITLASPRTAGKITFDAGETSYSLSGASITLKGSGGIGITANSSATINSPLVLDAPQQWDVAAGRVVTANGVLSGTSLTKTGNGTLVLTNANTYSGPTLISAGELRADNSSGSATGNGPVTVNAGGKLSGSGTVAGSVTVGNGGAVALAAGAGALQVGSLTLNSSSVQFSFGGGGYHSLNISGPLDVLDATTIQLINPPTWQEFSGVLIDYSGPALSDAAFGRLSLAYSAPCLADVELLQHDKANTQIVLYLHMSLAPPSWKGGSGSWANPCNWLSGHPSGAFYSSGFASVVTLDGDQTSQGLIFSSSTSYTIAPPGSLTLSGGQIYVAGASHFITAPLILPNGAPITVDTGASLDISGGLSLAAAKTIQKTGRGILKVSGPLSMGSGSVLDVAGGAVRLNSNAGTPENPTMSVNIHADGSGSDAVLTLGADQDWTALTITNGPGKQGLDLNSPTTAGGFHALRIKASDLQGAKAALAASIRSAAANPGDGIFDSGIASHQNSAVGIAIVNNLILIRPTRLGDLNLDGVVTISDLIELASNFNSTNKTWQEGDLNNDGVVTISDFIDLASNFNVTYSGQTIPLSQSDREALDAFAAAHGVAIPEPASIAIIFFSSLAALRPRRLQFTK